MLINFEISIGDFVDRMTIAQLKATKIGGEALEKDFHRFSSVYTRIYNNLSPDMQRSLEGSYDILLAINESLWVTEDEVRDVISDEAVANKTRMIIKFNDSRASQKRQLDQLFGHFGDPKQYVGKSRNYSI